MKNNKRKLLIVFISYTLFILSIYFILSYFIVSNFSAINGMIINMEQSIENVGYGIINSLKKTDEVKISENPIIEESTKAPSDEEEIDNSQTEEVNPIDSNINEESINTETDTDEKLVSYEEILSEYFFARQLSYNYDMFYLADFVLWCEIDGQNKVLFVRREDDHKYRIYLTDTFSGTPIIVLKNDTGIGPLKGKSIKIIDMCSINSYRSTHIFEKYLGVYTFKIEDCTTCGELRDMYIKKVPEKYRLEQLPICLYPPGMSDIILWNEHYIIQSD